MRELSIEEKAKRYDKAIEIAKEINNEQRAQPFNVMTRVFHELAESEDGKIRKEIISAIKEDWPGHKDWIAWLEAQGRQMFADGTFVNMDDVREDFVQEVYRVLDADSTNDRANQIIDAFDNLPTVAIEKQGEQKPVVIPKFRVGDIIRSCFNNEAIEKIIRVDNEFYIFDNGCYARIEYQDNWELVEQKPVEWSEEDELMRESIIDTLKLTFGAVQMKIDWLKSLKDRVQPQPKQEWNEDDETVLSNLIWALKEDMVLAGDRDEYVSWLQSLKDKTIPQPKQEWSKEDEARFESCIKILQTSDGYDTINAKWLKSLRPQNRWKPSDEHYELEEFAKIVRCNLTGISKDVQKLFEAKYLQLTGNKMYGGYKD